MTEVKMPDPEYMGCDSVGDIFAYTEAQLKQYGDDRAREALEMAAQVAVDAIAFNGGTVQMEAHVRTSIKKEIK